MRFRIGSQVLDRPAFWLRDGVIHLLDQRKLPSSIEIIETGSIAQQVDLIRTLAVRGAPAIGSFAAYSLSTAIDRGEEPKESYDMLLGSRPTAVDLRNCLDEVMERCNAQGLSTAVDTADEIYHRTIDACRRIGENGAVLIPDDARIMTHCNAGALASVDWGTALAPIRIKKKNGGNPFVWVSETRPLLQGARLTAWELGEEGIDHRIIVDSASGHLMKEGKVDLVITGADRVCANGDFANKIGTYEKAVLASRHNIPFYIAFPWTTYDPSCRTGEDIPIEERDSLEVLSFWETTVAPSGSEAVNPAFDVTPPELVTAYITPDGVYTLDEFKKLF